MRHSVTSAARFWRPSSSPSTPINNLISRPRNVSTPCLLCLYSPRPSISSRQFRTSAILPIRNSPTLKSSSAGSSPAGESPSSNPQTPDITNHYTIFPKTLSKGLPPATPFDIPLADLRREFFALQGLVHPDKFPSGEPKQRAEALSSRINEAYRTLCDPLLRAQYLLSYQHDIDVTAEDGANSHPQDPETLMQVLEVQEAIEEAGSEDTVAELKKENEARIDESVSALGRAIDHGDIKTATKECLKLRFWYTIREGLKEWEPGNETVRLVH